MSLVNVRKFPRQKRCAAMNGSAAATLRILASTMLGTVSVNMVIPPAPNNRQGGCFSVVEIHCLRGGYFRRHRCATGRARDACAHRVPESLKRALLDLPDPLPRNPELPRQLVERLRLVREHPSFECCPFARRQ
jgi:hypothetical protein